MKLFTSRKHRRLYRKLSCIYTGEMSGENISCLLREYDICCHTPEWASPNVWCCQSFQPTTVQMPTYFWETAASKVHCSYLNTKNYKSRDENYKSVKWTWVMAFKKLLVTLLRIILTAGVLYVEVASKLFTAHKEWLKNWKEALWIPESFEGRLGSVSSSDSVLSNCWGVFQTGLHLLSI